jgi:hypothetical protein
VRIYLFDNHGTPAEQTKPIHQFDFTAATWQAHLRDGNLGPSYHVFVPYVRGGHEQVECSLQVRFTPKDGPVVYSDMTSVVLPGTTEPAEPPGTPLASSRSAAGASDPASDQVRAKPSLAVHTVHQANLTSRPTTVRPAAGHRPFVDSAVQQASAVTATAPVYDDRLDRLERMMTQLLEARTAAAPAAAPRAAPMTAPRTAPVAHPLLQMPPQSAPHALPETARVVTETERRRFRLTPVFPAAPPVAQPHSPMITQQDAWSQEPAPRVQHEIRQPVHTGVGTSYYPSWSSLDTPSPGAGHPLSLN